MGAGDHFSEIAGIRSVNQFGLNRQTSEEYQIFLLRREPAPVSFEKVNPLPALGTYETAHVFYQTQDMHVDLAAEIYRLSHIGQGYFLGGCNDDGLCIRNGLGYGQRLIACSRGGNR